MMILPVLRVEFVEDSEGARMKQSYAQIGIVVAAASGDSGA
jgi:hypothetical protein